MTMDAVTLLTQQARGTHQWLEGTMGDINSAQAQWAPEGAVSAGAHYAHIVNGEDALINAVAKGGAPMAATDWAGKTGLSEPIPQGPFSDWSRTVTVDLPALRTYGQAVFANTEAYIASLTPDDLDREIDLSALGIGKMSLGYFISGIVLGNANWHCGEISLLKGLQGLKGYPA
jgi:hypothetical protein